MKQTERVELCDTLFRVHQCELHVREREKAREEGEEGEEPSSVPSRGTKRYVKPLCHTLYMYVHMHVSELTNVICYTGQRFQLRDLIFRGDMCLQELRMECYWCSIQERKR